MTDQGVYEQIRDGLAEIYTPEGVDIWMTAEHKQWDGWTVSEMVNHGRADEVLAVIDRLASGSFG